MTDDAELTRWVVHQGSGVVAFCPVSRSCEIEDGEGAGGVVGDVTDGLGDVADSGQA